MSSSEADELHDVNLPKLLASLATAVRAVQGLPSSQEDYDYETSFPEFGGKSMQSTRSLWLDLVQNILHTPGLVNNHPNDEEDRGTTSEDTSYETMDDPLLWDECAELCELLLEQITGLAEVTESTTTATSTLQHARDAAMYKSSTQWSRMQNLLVVDLPKPQEVYSHLVPPVPENSRSIAFIPIIHPDKPNSIVQLPLQEQGTSVSVNGRDTLQQQIQLQPGHGLDTRFGPNRTKKIMEIPMDIVAPTEHCPHLYQTEIESFTYNEEQLQVNETIDLSVSIPTVHPLHCTLIETVEQLEQFVTLFQKVHATEMAVDLEAHSYRTFAGLVCLMQVTFCEANDNTSITHYNYLIDTLGLPRANINRMLLPIFTNPSIVKILHGADSDIQWLQRDFGLYVVNMFDTGRASRALTYASASYAFLLKKYCDETIVVDKSHQLADWRQRPLPNEMQQYAIQDTFYLIDIYHRLKIELYNAGGTDMIRQVLDTSRQICLVRYTPEPFKPSGYKVLIRDRRGKSNSFKHHRSRNELSRIQEHVLRELWDWRDRLARKEDESLQYVCTNNVLLRLSLASPLSVSQLQSLFHPVPPYLVKHSQALIDLVKKATAAGAKEENEDDAPHIENDDEEGEIDDDEEEEELRGNEGNVKGTGEDLYDDEEDDDDDEEEEESILRPPVVSKVDASASSAFFKPASRHHDQEQARRRGMMSPVLGTEALYKQAGWMTPQEREDQVRMYADRYFLEQKVAAESATGTKSDDGNKDDPRRLLPVHGTSDVSAQKNSDHSSNDGKLLIASTSSSAEARSRATSLDGMATVKAAKELGVNKSFDIALEKEVASKKAAVIGGSLKSSVPMVLSLAPSTLDENLDNRDDSPLVDDDDASEEGTPLNKSTDKTKGGTEANEAEHYFVIPRSIREIYQISNRNRRHKKAGSPERSAPLNEQREAQDLLEAEALLKAKGLMDANGYSQLFDDNNTGLNAIKRQRAKTGRDSEESVPETMNPAAREDDLAFMKEIGWVREDEDVDSILNQRYSKSRSSDSCQIESMTRPDDGNAGAASSHGSIMGSSVESKHTSSNHAGSTTPPVGLLQHTHASPMRNPFFSGAAMVGGPLAEQGISKPEPRRVMRNVSGNWRQQNRSASTGNRQHESPDQRGDRTFSYRKK